MLTQLGFPFYFAVFSDKMLTAKASSAEAPSSVTAAVAAPNSSSFPTQQRPSTPISPERNAPVHFLGDQSSLWSFTCYWKTAGALLKLFVVSGGVKGAHVGPFLL